MGVWRANTAGAIITGCAIMAGLAACKPSTPAQPAATAAGSAQPGAAAAAARPDAASTDDKGDKGDKKKTGPIALAATSVATIRLPGEDPRVEPLGLDGDALIVLARSGAVTPTAFGLHAIPLAGGDVTPRLQYAEDEVNSAYRQMHMVGGLFLGEEPPRKTLDALVAELQRAHARVPVDHVLVHPTRAGVFYRAVQADDPTQTLRWVHHEPDRAPELIMPEGVSWPTISPDGAWLAFEREADTPQGPHSPLTWWHTNDHKLTRTDATLGGISMTWADDSSALYARRIKRLDSGRFEACLLRATPGSPDVQAVHCMTSDQHMIMDLSLIDGGKRALVAYLTGEPLKMAVMPRGLVLVDLTTNKPLAQHTPPEALLQHEPLGPDLGFGRVWITRADGQPLLLDTTTGEARPVHLTDPAGQPLKLDASTAVRFGEHLVLTDPLHTPGQLRVAVIEVARFGAP